MLRLLRSFLLSDRRDEVAAAPGPDALVHLHRRAGRYYIEPCDRTRLAEAGYWVTTGEVTVLAAEVSDVALGDAVMGALARSRVEVAAPPRGTRLQAGLVRAMGVRSFREAMTGTRTCVLSREPARRAPRGGGTTAARLTIEAVHHDEAPAGDVTVPDPVSVDLRAESTPMEIGRVVRETLQQASMNP